MKTTAELQIEHDHNMGKAIAKLLGLRTIPRGEQTHRYSTTWGTKTPIGLYNTLRRFIDDDDPGAA